MEEHLPPNEIIVISGSAVPLNVIWLIYTLRHLAVQEKFREFKNISS